MRKQLIWGMAVLTLIAGCGNGGGSAEPTHPSTARTSTARTTPTLAVGQAGTYEQADQDGQLARYKITLQGLKRTANGASVTFLSANISQSSGGMPLNKEYALAPDGTRMDDIAVASEGAITDPGPGQKKAVTVEYALPTGFAGRIVFVAYDGMKEYDAFSVAVPTR